VSAKTKKIGKTRRDSSELKTSVKNPKPQLMRAMKQHRLLRFSQRFEKFQIHGYVVAVGSQFFLLALVSDRLHFDGFECFRIKDVYNLKPDSNRAFIEAALKLRKERMLRPRINMASIEKILLSATRMFPLIAIQREQIDPDVCWIGRVVAIEGKHISMLEISPQATWDSKPSLYLMREITRVGFGGDYENALYLVGGEPPKVLSLEPSAPQRKAKAKKSTVKKRAN